MDIFLDPLQGVMLIKYTGIQCAICLDVWGSKEPIRSQLDMISKVEGENTLYWMKTPTNELFETPSMK